MCKLHVVAVFEDDDGGTFDIEITVTSRGNMTAQERLDQRIAEIERKKGWTCVRVKGRTSLID